jgi:hypothetical protein
MSSGKNSNSDKKGRPNPDPNDNDTTMARQLASLAGPTGLRPVPSKGVSDDDTMIKVSINGTWCSLRKSTKLDCLFKTFALHITGQNDYSKFKFTFGFDTLSAEQTPSDVGIENNATIHATIHAYDI